MNDDIRKRIREAALSQGFCQAEYLEMKDVKFYREFRKVCEDNGCGRYGKSWVCPPAFGSFEDGKSKILSYSNFLLFTKKYDIEGSFDYDGMMDGMRDFRRSIPAIESFAKDAVSGENGNRGVFVLSVGSCGLCRECTYPDSPCRYPELLHHPLEGYGLNVGELAQTCGIRYNNGPGTVTYFGTLLF